MTLTETARLTKRGFVVFVILLIGYFASQKVWAQVKDVLFPPKVPPPEVAFGKLPTLDIPNLPFAGVLGLKSFERFLHRYGDLFFFHAQLDSQPKEYALAGLGLIVLLYNVAIVLLMFLEHRQRNSVGNRAWRAHRHILRSPSRRTRRRHRRERRPAEPSIPIAPPPLPSDPPLLLDADDPVIHRIRPEDAGQAS